MCFSICNGALTYRDEDQFQKVWPTIDRNKNNTRKTTDKFYIFILCLPVCTVRMQAKINVCFYVKFFNISDVFFC